MDCCLHCTFSSLLGTKNSNDITEQVLNGMCTSRSLNCSTDAFYRGRSLAPDQRAEAAGAFASPHDPHLQQSVPNCDHQPVCQGIRDKDGKVSCKYGSFVRDDQGQCSKYQSFLANVYKHLCISVHAQPTALMCY